MAKRGLLLFPTTTTSSQNLSSSFPFSKAYYYYYHLSSYSPTKSTNRTTNPLFSLSLSNRSLSVRSSSSQGQNGNLIDLSKYNEAFANRMALAGLQPHHPIALGVSGGPDSIALCELASSWKKRGKNNVVDHENGFIDGLLAIIVDHGLRPESKEEAHSVSRRVFDMGISCEIAHCEWLGGKPMKGHLQEAARDRRYQIFHNICLQHEIGVLLVAHHADDQAELFIIRLSRNSGVLGLAGMAFTSQLYSKDPYFYDEDTSEHGILLVRPLLEFSKDDMYQICQGANQEWVEDPTNKSPAYARNRIRLTLEDISSSMFDCEVQAVISACRKTRTYIDQMCGDLINRSVSVMPQGYAVIDLAILNPSKVVDLCLSKFISLVLQFVSQKHKPVRGSALKQLLDYFRNIPCKECFTAAGCSLCPSPGSKGTKILVCCSINCTSPVKNEFLHTISHGQKHLSMCDISQIIADGKSYIASLIPDTSDVPFLNVECTESILVEAKRLDLLSEFTFRSIVSMQKDETGRFRSLRVEESDDKLKPEPKTIGYSSNGTLQRGEIGYFMSRFFVKWDQTDKSDSSTKDGNQSLHCNSCLLGHDDVATIRHMVDADWLYLAKLSRGDHLKNSEVQRVFSGEVAQQVIDKTNVYMHAHVSAQKALLLLKSIPVSARRGLPVLENTRGQMISIPSVGFNHCPCLRVSADFRPRVPLGGGFSSFI